MKGSFQRFRIFSLFVLAVSIVLLSAWNVNAQYSIFSGQVPTKTGTDGDYELGTRFTSSRPAEITAIRFYKLAGETGTHTGRIWSNAGTVSASITFSSESPSGWQTAVLSSPLKIEPNTIYVVSVNVNKEYAIAEGGFSAPIANGFLTGTLGVFNNDQAQFPSYSWLNSNYFVDIVASPLDQIFTTQVATGNPFTGEGDLELGLKFTTSAAAKVRYIRFYKLNGEPNSGHIGKLWEEGKANPVTSVAFTNETADGWQYAKLTDNVYLEAGHTYVVSVNSNNAYAARTGDFNSPLANGVLTASVDNGVYSKPAGTYPTTVFESKPNYFRDIVVIPLPAPAAPVLTSPANNMSGVSIEPVLSWGAIAGVTSYTLEIAENSGFTQNLRTFTGITTNSFTVTGLLNSKTYYWRVKGMNDNVPGALSAASQFTTIGFTNVVLSYPKGGTKVYTETPSLTWYVPTGGAGWKYDLIYSTDQNFISSVTTISNLTQGLYTLGNLLPGTPYYWKVRLKTSTGAVVGYSARESFISFGEAFKPVASWPTGNATVYSLSQDLYWYVNGASTGLTYDLELREGGVLIFTKTGITETHFTVTNLKANQQYSWHVKSRTEAGTPSEWSNDANFKTAAMGTVLKPVASWPVNYPVVYTVTPSLNWYLGGSSDGLTFEVEIVKGLTTPFSGVPTYDKITTLSFIVTTPLTPGEDYKWQVRSSGGVGKYSEWSNAATFKVAGTIGNALVVPTPSWPVKGAKVYSSEATLSWYTGTASTGLKYEIQYGTGALSDEPATKAGIENMFYLLKDLTPGVTYNWRVRSVNSLNHSAWSRTETFTTISNAPVAKQPTLSWPIKGVTVYTSSPLLSWFVNGPSLGLKYKLEYTTSSTSWTGAIVRTGIEATQFQMANLTPGATYYWRVYSYDESVESAPSATGSFVVFAGNAAVVPLAGSPVQGIQTGSVSPVLSWYIPTSGDVESYIVEYSKKPDMSEPVSMEVKGNSVALDKLSAESAYYWRVRSLNSKGEKSAFSDVESFSTSSVTGVEKEEGSVPTEFSLKQNYPNPFNPATMIEFSLAKDGFYSLDVYNILGQKVSSLMQANMKSGSYKVSFNAKDFMSGIYFYRLTGDGVNMVKKMLLVK